MNELAGESQEGTRRVDSNLRPAKSGEGEPTSNETLMIISGKVMCSGGLLDGRYTQDVCAMQKRHENQVPGRYRHPGEQSKENQRATRLCLFFAFLQFSSCIVVWK